MKTKEKDQIWQGWLDRVAISLCGACGVHCLVTPLFLVSLPILAGSFLVEERFHYWMLACTLPVTGLAVYLGCRRHKDRKVFLLAASGMGILILAAAFGHDLVGHEGEAAMTVAGGIVLAIGHIRNFRLGRNRTTVSETV